MKKVRSITALVNLLGPKCLSLAEVISWYHCQFYVNRMAKLLKGNVGKTLEVEE
jgi:hypothetical protein